MDDLLVYNMFNHHFFDGPAGRAVYDQFLMDSGKENQRLALVMDPPFGGKVDVLSHTIGIIGSDYRRLNSNDSLSISSTKLQFKID